MAELVLGDEAVGADAEGGGGQAMVVNRIGLGVHQKRIVDTRECTHQTYMSKELTSSNKWSNTHVVRMPHGGRWGTSGRGTRRRMGMRCQSRTRHSRRRGTSTGTARTSLRPPTDIDAIILAICYGTRVDGGPRGGRITVLALA
jgi:hypothetical protein